MRCRISVSNHYAMVHDSIPALIPPEIRNAALAGTHVGRVGAEEFRAQAEPAIERARSTKTVQRIEWHSLMNGKLRIAIFLPHPTGSVTMRVFAEAEEAEAIAPDRRNTGTEGSE